MQRHEKYKDSGIDWLREIPEHWEVKKVKEVAKLYGRIGFRGYNTSDLVSKGQGAITISPSNIEDWEMKFHKNTYLSWDKYEESPEIQIFNDDILIVKTGSTVGKIGIVKCLEEKATINPQLLVVKNIKLNSDFLYSFLKTTFFYDLIKSNAIGSTIPTISESKIGSLLILQPPIHEQKAIVLFLDDKCKKIDAAVNLKEQQIEKLRELRQITIHNAVTKGVSHLKGEALSMKDSGIDWIGEIPEHWKVATFKMVSTFILDGTHGSYPRTESGFRLLSVRNIVKDEFILRDDDSFISKIHFEEITKKFLNKEGDILLTIVGGTLGKASIIKVISEKFATQRSLATIRIREIYNNLFYYYYIISPGYQSFLWSNTNYSAQPGIYLNTISNSNVVIPPFLEQIQIVSYLENQTSKIDKAIAQKQEQIVKLKEYKQSLINEVVTGKIKVAG